MSRYPTFHRARSAGAGRRALVLAGLSSLGGCLTPNADWAGDPIDKPPPGMVLQGMVGLSFVEPDGEELYGGIGQTQSSDDATMPTLGAAFQYPLTGQRVRVGMEGGFSLGWQGDFDSAVLGNGAAVIVVDSELVLWDVFVGLFADMFVGERWRLYAGAGPLMQFGSIDADYDDPLLGRQSLDDDGFGGGFYLRTGIDFELYPGTYVGFGYRVLDTELDFSSPLGDLPLWTQQLVFTVSQRH